MIQDLLDYLVDEYNPEAVILWGSRAGNVHSLNSDWDFLLYVNEIKNTESFVLYKDQYLDIEQRGDYNKDSIFETKSGVPVIDLKVLLDNTGNTINKIIKNTKLVWDNGPNALSSDQVNSRQLFMSKKIIKLESNIDNILVFNYFLGQLYVFLVSCWFELRAEWPLKIYQALPYIKKHDPEFFENLANLIREKERIKKIIVAKQIYNHLFKNNEI